MFKMSKLLPFQHMLTFLRETKIIYYRRNIATVINGKTLAKKILTNLRQEVEQFVYQHERVPHLAVILVGENPASEVYVKNKITAAQVVGDHSLYIW